MRVDVGRENSTVIELQVGDLGFGPPVLLVHGWPVSSRIWEPQVHALLGAGYRVLSYDRRGFGRSSRCSTGFDVDTLAEDLKQVLETLDLRDCAVLAFGMGCSELLRYLGTFGDDRLRAAAFVAPLPPTPSATAPPGQDLGDAAVEALRSALRRERPVLLGTFIEDAFAAADLPVAHRLGDATKRALWLDAVDVGPVALVESLQAWQADLRDDLPRICLPTLVLQGGADHLAPAAAAATRLAAGIAGARLQIVARAPHGLLWTHAADVNESLLAFLR